MSTKVTRDSIFESLQKQSHETNKNVLAGIKKLHAYLLTRGMLLCSPGIHTHVMTTYASCLGIETLNNSLRSMNSTSPIHFNLIISHLCHRGFPLLALATFSFMHSNAIPLDTYALCTTFTASSRLQHLQFAKQMHSHALKSGFSSSVFVASPLIDLYSKLSSVNDAVQVFDEMPHRNTVCANALLSRYGDAGLWVQGLDLVRKMPSLNLKYDRLTLSAALRACTGLSSVEMGRQLHCYLLRTVRDIECDVFLQTALIELYGKCGFVKKALQVFRLSGTQVRKERIRRDLVLWTSMLGVYGRNGHHKEVIDLYNEMLGEGIRPDRVAFLTVISACGRNGQVEDGVKYFESMASDFKLDPGPEHYSCLVDLLCRAGELHKAWEILDDIDNKGMGNCIISVWGALLSACVDGGNLELGKLAAQRALELDPSNVGICIMLSNLYARFGMWDEIRELRVFINARGLRKDVGCSWVQVTS